MTDERNNREVNRPRRTKISIEELEAWRDSKSEASCRWRERDEEERKTA